MIAGLLVMIASEAATLAHIEPFYSWNTPICWTGFILFADSVVYRARGRSWMRSNPREFALLALVSVPLWLVFEGYNHVLHNWYYVGLPENFWLRMFGYAWSFATIWPAIFEGADLISVARGQRPVSPPHPYPAAPSMALGAILLASPFLMPDTLKPYMAAPVWLGFIFLLDPVNRRLGGESLADDSNRAANLLLSGALCGVLWEFWNYCGRQVALYGPDHAERQGFRNAAARIPGISPVCGRMFHDVRLSSIDVSQGRGWG